MYDTIEEKLRQLLAENLKIDKEIITHGSKLSDWGADSLQFLETIFEVETSFGISFPDDAGQEISDFDSIVKVVKEQLAKKENAAA
ncbi:MAG: acyl carrier protein [Pseudomonadota bacterium]|jgi:acyl carrier protein|nr:acyl carrier protein [Gammaproteobacteria bacterium]MEC9360144.1 acyl carrier protein [Pseudomonadota bacterium]